MLSELNSILALVSQSIANGIASASASPIPLDAVTDAAETTSEAFVGLFAWLASGEDGALVALGTAFGVAIALYGLRMALGSLIPRLPQRDEFSLSAIAKRLVKRFRSYFILTASLFAASHFVAMPAAIEAGLGIAFVVTGVIQIAEFLQEILVSLIRRSASRRAGDAVALASAVNILKWLVSVVIWSVALLLILDNVGADVTALLAGLGVGGIAIGLAAQGVFRDLFSALSIIFDRPFQRGDVIQYDDTYGRIEDIGLKTTRIRSVTGEQIIMSNTNLLDLEIHNLARMPKRRIETGFGIVYHTHPDVAEQVVDIVTDLATEMDGIELDRCNFIGFGNSSLDYELVFYSLNPDFRASRAATSRLLLAVFRKFHEQDIQFAFPTQTIHVASMPDDAASDIAGAVEQTLKSVNFNDAA